MDYMDHHKDVPNPPKQRAAQPPAESAGRDQSFDLSTYPLGAKVLVQTGNLTFRVGNVRGVRQSKTVMSESLNYLTEKDASTKTEYNILFTDFTEEERGRSVIDFDKFWFLAHQVTQDATQWAFLKPFLVKG